MQYIYLVHPIRFLQTGEPSYKIGKTTTNICKYIMANYKDCNVIFTQKVNDCHTLEKKIIKLFNKIFIKRSEIGYEYYTGDVEKMVTLITSLITSMNVSNASIKQIPMLKKRLDLVKNRTNEIKNEPVLGNVNIDDDINYDNDSNNDHPEDKKSTVNISINLPDDVDSMNIINITKVQKKTLDTFTNFIKTTKPDWYIEDTYVDFSIIEEAYRSYFNDHNIHTSIISRLLKNLIFTKSRRLKNVNNKLLKSFSEL